VRRNALTAPDDTLSPTDRALAATTHDGRGRGAANALAGSIAIVQVERARTITMSITSCDHTLERVLADATELDHTLASHRCVTVGRT